ncbi:MAG: NAD(P)-dependent alcohol dehydrogenase [Merismopedia sp. SIO2A8]|nr:NAD(P)-dependent alcohol dehydrogenase [Merismopedia sp. SIO2A8]
MKTIAIASKFGIDALVVNPCPEPTVGSGQILVKVKAVALNYRDLLVVKGEYSRNLPLPLIPGSDGVGEVVAVGEGVSQAQVGDRVAGTFMSQWVDGPLTKAATQSALGGGTNGMLAEYVVLPESGIVKVPAHLSDVEAATLPCAAVTAWHSLMELGLGPGQTVLLLGTGGVSLFALQFAVLAGAQVIITSSNDDKLARTQALAASMGATIAGINYVKTPEWGKQVLALTEKNGVDYVVEVGGAGTLPQSLKAVAFGGTISLIGVLTGNQGMVNPVPAVMKGVRLCGIYVGSRAMFERMNRAIALHQLHPVIDRVFGFDEVAQAFHYLEAGKHFGKICISL